MRSLSSMPGSSTLGFCRPSRSVSSKSVNLCGTSRPLRFTSFQSKMNSPARSDARAGSIVPWNQRRHGWSIGQCAWTSSNLPSSSSSFPGTRASFRRRVIDALREARAGLGRLLFLRQGRRARLRRRDAHRRRREPAGARGPASSSPPRSASTRRASSPRRAAPYVATELWPDAERARCPTSRTGRIADGFVHSLLLFLHEGGVLFGLAGLERRFGEGAFTEDDKHGLEGIAPFIVAGARAQLQYDELSREAAALRSLGKVSGIIYVVDRDKKRVVWAADREHGIDWEVDVEPLEDQLVDAVETSLAARARGDALPTPPRLPTGSVVAVARIDEDPVFGGARCAAVRVEAPQRPAAIEGLSKREREIARLLVAGYSGVNVAAISGLSENTVRTYVRRLYGKLGVNNRADLVRKLVSPEPAVSTAPPSQIAPPPDSLAGRGGRHAGLTPSSVSFDAVVRQKASLVRRPDRRLAFDDLSFRTPRARTRRPAPVLSRLQALRREVDGPCSRVPPPAT